MKTPFPQIWDWRTRFVGSWLRAALLSVTAAGALAAAEPALRVTSPDGGLAAELRLNAEGELRYSIYRGKELVLRESKLGLVRADADFTRGLKLLSAEAAAVVTDEYEILTAKRRQNRYAASRRVFHLAAERGQKVDVIFQVSNDGVAFRYFFPETDATVRRLKAEATSFHFPAGTRAWLQPMAVARSGWEGTNPSYEEIYQKDIAVGTASPTGAGWVYPALFKSGETWLLVSEGSLPRNYCGTRLQSESPEGEYTVGFPDPKENFQGGAVNPESTLPWLTPWRFVVVGGLDTVVESMLGVDLAEPAAASARASASDAPTQAGGTPAHLGGKASWSWPLLGDPNTSYDVQKRFIDYAAEMGWRYTLIDALWDKQIGYEKVAELVEYARTKNVKILLWYNSAGDWCTAPQTPRDRMLTRESRRSEFARLKQIGVAGLKVDFFGGDGQSQIAYYHDILQDAAEFGFAMNFHGCTLPRGWQRTYPHLMTMEAIRGLEFVTFEQRNADEQPAHATMLPFTRNVFDPMDFTPVVLDQIRNIERRTTSGFELALAVLFTSGIQHYAEIPEGLAKAPRYVRDYLKRVPSVWEDVKFLDGMPGQFVVLARRGDGYWHIAGINGEAKERKVTLDLRKLNVPATSRAELITDGDGGNLSFRREEGRVDGTNRVEVRLKPRGGFVMAIEVLP